MAPPQRPELAELELGRYIALVIVAAEDRMSRLQLCIYRRASGRLPAGFAFDDDYSFGILSVVEPAPRMVR